MRGNQGGALVGFLVGLLLGCVATAVVFFFGFRLWDKILGTDPEVKEPLPVEITQKCSNFEKVEPPWLIAENKNVEGQEPLLDIPSSLGKRVQFWKDVWGKYPNNYYLLVDRRLPWIVHETVDCRQLFVSPEEPESSKLECEQRIITRKRRVENSLKKQSRHPQRALVKLYNNKKTLARSAFQNVYLVEGRMESLSRAMERASLFIGNVEQIFLSLGVPRALASMTIVESLANPAAQSSAGAVGAYQFVSNTASEYLSVNDGIDERLDPQRSGWAAANYLKSMFSSFESWPLTLTAYNTGPTRLKQIIMKRRTQDLGKLVDAGDLRNFGFDGQNYYSQIMAVAQLKSETLAPKNLERLEVFRVLQAMPLGEVAECLKTPVEHIITFNPAITDRIKSECKPVPQGYLIAVPSRTEEKNLTTLSER